MYSVTASLIEEPTTQLSESQSSSPVLSKVCDKLDNGDSEILLPLEQIDSSQASEVEGKKPWNEEEEFNMILAHYKYKNKWSEIGSVLKSRNNTIKNRFYSIFRRIKGKIQRGDVKYNSKLELLEMYYIVSLVEYYLKNPSENPRTKGKRGKDFIYSLVHNVSQQTVRSYKERVEEYAKHEGTMEELMLQLISEGKCSPALKNVLAHSLPTAFPGNSEKQPQKFQEPSDDFFANIAHTDFENYLPLEIGFKSPASVFSPSTFSAGPSTVIARAHRAACFKDAGFSDASALAGNWAEEGRRGGFTLWEGTAEEEKNLEEGCKLPGELRNSEYCRLEY